MSDYNTPQQLPDHLSQFMQPGGMEKSAAPWLQLGKLMIGRLGRALYNQNISLGVGSGGKFLGRVLGAAPDKLGGRRGLWYDGTKVVNKADRNMFQRAGDWLWDKSDKLSEWGLNKADKFNKQQQAALDAAGKGWGRAGKVMGGAAAWSPEIAMVGTVAYPLITGNETPEWMETAATLPYVGWEYFNPWGIAMTGGYKAFESFSNSAQEAAVNAAEEASRKTLQEVANGIRNQGFGANLYQMFNPSGYSQELLNRGNAAIDKEIKTYRDMINARNG